MKTSDKNVNEINNADSEMKRKESSKTSAGKKRAGKNSAGKKTRGKNRKDSAGNGKTLIRLIRDMKVIYGWLVFAAFISLLSVVCSLATPEIMGELTDQIYGIWEGVSSFGDSDISRWCALLAIVYVGASLTSTIKMMLMNYVVSGFFTKGMRIRISDKISRLPVSYIDHTPNGEIIAKMDHDVSIMGGTVHNFLDIIISGVMKLVGIGVILFAMNWVMALVVIILVPFSLVLSSWLASYSEKYYNESRKINGNVYALVEENFTGFDTVKAFNLESMKNNQMKELCGKYREKARQGYFYSGIVQPVIALTNNIAYIVICILGGMLAVEGSLSVGEIVAFVLYAKQLAGPLESIANGMSMMQSTFASAKRVYELLDLEEMETVQTKKMPAGKGEVAFDHVSFSYDPEKPLIKDLSFTVKPGQKAAIVGPTGGGKTTIVNLLMGFYPIQEGHIYIDGVDISTLDLADLRSQFAMVLQDTWLFGGTVYENIAYGNEGASREAVEQAAKMAHIDRFIQSLPKGYDTVINEETTNISGGQKQLMTIARAYLANRRMLILDEATSNVDTRTELLIQDTMDELMKGRTSFVIAHRLSTIVNADMILVVNQGQIVEQGTHEELMKKNGFYTEIYNSQYELLK